MNYRLSALVVAMVVLLARIVPAGILYSVSEPGSFLPGARDENILADDIHIASGATLTNIELRLSIMGSQQCMLWVFDGFQEQAIYTQSFVNVASAVETNFVTYSFPLNLRVPKDFYIGYSAQGAGWGNNGTDWAATGTRVDVGLPLNSGLFFYGPVAGGKLTQVYNPGYGIYFDVRVEGVPDIDRPLISGIVVSNGVVALAMTNLTANRTNIVQKQADILSNEWHEADRFVPTGSSAVWSETISNSTKQCFYRLMGSGSL